MRLLRKLNPGAAAIMLAASGPCAAAALSSSQATQASLPSRKAVAKQAQGRAPKSPVASGSAAARASANAEARRTRPVRSLYVRHHGHRGWLPRASARAPPRRLRLLLSRRPVRPAVAAAYRRAFARAPRAVVKLVRQALELAEVLVELGKLGLPFSLSTRSSSAMSSSEPRGRSCRSLATDRRQQADRRLARGAPAAQRGHPRQHAQFSPYPGHRTAALVLRNQLT